MNQENGMSEPVISVVIPAFNAERTLGLQLDALDTQEGAPPFEVVVVDNASTDRTADLVRRRAGEMGYPLRLVSAPEHQGPGYARNVGAAAAQADLLMFTDSDDVVSRWWVAAGERAFTASPLWNGGARLMTDEEMLGGLDQIWAAAGDSAEWIDVVPGDLSDAFPVVMGCDFGCTRAAFEEIGGFDQSMGTAFEDNDFGLRAHLARIPVDQAPAVRVAYRGRWDYPSRARLARRQARGHMLAVERYGLRERSRMPHPVREIVNPIIAAGLMALGRREREWGGPYLRLSAGLGLAEGRLRYGAAKRMPPPQIGLGYARAPLGPQFGDDYIKEERS